MSDRGLPHCVWASKPVKVRHFSVSVYAAVPVFTYLYLVPKHQKVIFSYDGHLL